MSDNTNFFNMVNASPTLTERWVKVAETVVTSARDLFGVHLDHEDVASLTSARASVLGAHDLDDFMAELSALEKVKARQAPQRREAPKASATVAQHHGTAGDDAYARAEERAATRRFHEARKAGFQPPADAPRFDPAKASDVEKIRHLMTISDPSRKIALARAWGLAG
ncbi:hypothetical protein SAMN04488103_102432 [Gemmobacter aquatilis]|uniref:Uncharacterized protein n=1 Tax=Gemmobacter aquatilis TaxID=933059 RepID=A0A1H8C913_9RHOB|nr:hypothetical protein [Gemmobacter aquatilis]SEM91545.1 hypothetical protein SAMN04488103_102432 [Gemmobacter aquatilis]